MINFHDNSCIGIVLFKSKTRFIQLWFCLSGYTIKPHSHDDEDIELMYICGKTTFFRMNGINTESFTPRWFNIFKRFTVGAGVVHWFSVSSFPLVFINFARFKNGIKPCSAAIDFHNK